MWTPFEGIGALVDQRIWFGAWIDWKTFLR